MFIKDIFSNKRLTISFELFPPKGDKNFGGINSTIEELKKLSPDFISVTYGAGGSSRSRTIELASIIKNKYDIETIAHLTCITSSKEEIDGILDELKSNNINNVLALRGDIPKDFKTKESFKYAKDLIYEIAQRKDFSISAAAYPEGHVECADIGKNIEYLKEKVEKGADFLITQLFFDNDNFYNFREELYKNNINVPVITGIIPVLDKKQIERIATLSGAIIPKKIKRIMDKYEHSPEALKEAGIAYTSEQIVDLISNDVQGIHLYTMNKHNAAKEIIENIHELRNIVNS